MPHILVGVKIKITMRYHYTPLRLECPTSRSIDIPRAGKDRTTVAPHPLILGIWGGGDGLVGESACWASLMTRGQFQTRSWSCASVIPTLRQEMGDGDRRMALNPSGQLDWSKQPAEVIKTRRVALLKRGKIRNNSLNLPFDLHMHACPYSHMYHTHMYTEQNVLWPDSPSVPFLLT